MIMKEYMNKLEIVTEQQIEYGKSFGLNLNQLPKDVARAMIIEVIDAYFSKEDKKAATENQINLGKKFNLDFTKFSCAVASVYIKNLMLALNYKSIEEQGIRPGDYVVNKHDKLKNAYIVSSINKAGYVF